MSNFKVDDDQPTALDQGTLFRAVSSGNLNALSALLRNRKIDINGYDKEVSVTHHCTQNESTLESLRGFNKRFLREQSAGLSHVFSASCRAVLCRAVPCRAVLCRAMLCRAVPCRTMPCCAVLCRAVLSCAVMRCRGERDLCFEPALSKTRISFPPPCSSRQDQHSDRARHSQHMLIIPATLACLSTVKQASLRGCSHCCAAVPACSTTW